MLMLSVFNYIIPSIATVFGVVFLCWFIARTPINLKKWYCVPVAIVLGVLIALCWSLCLLG